MNINEYQSINQSNYLHKKGKRNKPNLMHLPLKRGDSSRYRYCLVSNNNNYCLLSSWLINISKSSKRAPLIESTLSPLR